MLLKKIGASNYFIAMLILLGITIALVVSAFIVTAIFPGSLGRIPYQYETETVCEFEPWSFELNNLEVNFPQGGIILTVNQTDRYRSNLLLGEGFYRNKETQVNNDLNGGLFIVTEHSIFEEIRGNNIFMPVEDEALLSQVARIGDNQKGIPAIWKDTIPVTFHAPEDLSYYYFVSPEGKPDLPPSANYSMPTVFGAFLVYTIFIAILVIVLTILSPDHRYSRYWMHLGNTPPRLFSLILIPMVLALVAITRIGTNLFNLSELYSAAGYFLILFILAYYAINGKIDYMDLGLRRDKIHNGYFLAITAAILVVCTIRGLPAGISTGGFRTFLQLPLLFLLVALPLELIWRGYIQTYLSRWLGVTKGLLAMVFLAAVTHFIYLLATEPWMSAYPYTYLEVAVLVPGTAFVLGYLYLRTENIMSCAVLHGLILWLPGILIY